MVPLVFLKEVYKTYSWGQDGDKYHHITEYMNQHALCAVQGFFLDGMQGVHGEAVALAGDVLGREHHRGDHNSNHCDSGGEALVLGDLAHELRIEDHGEGPVSLTHEHGSAEVREGPDKDQERPGQQGRRDQGEDYLEKPAYSGAAHVFTGLQKGVVHLAQGPGHIEEDQGEQLRGEHQKHAIEPIDVRGSDAEQGLDEICDDAVAAQQQNPRVSAYEGSGHGGDNDEDAESLLSPDFVQGKEIGHGNAHQQRGDGGPEGDLEAVDQGGGVVGLGEEFDEVVQGKAIVPVKGHLDQIAQGIDHEQKIHGQDRQGDNAPDVQAETVIVLHAAYPRSRLWSPCSS